MNLRTLQLPFAIFLSTAFSASASVLYVDVNSTNPTTPYSSWSTAATNIQDAVDVANTSDLVLVTNGLYQTGGRIVSIDSFVSNRVAVTKSITVQSVNGPTVTVIQGSRTPNPVRCVYLTNNAVLIGFTITNGYSGASASGGGVYSLGVVSNCIITGNAATLNGGGIIGGLVQNCTLAFNSAFSGGGAALAVLSNCAIINNSASYTGGGASECSSLTHCTIAGNSALSSGGGIYNDVFPADSAVNCIIYYNSAPAGANYLVDSTDPLSFSNCCTLPLPSVGLGNITTEPLLLDLAHISADSPCRGAGISIDPAGVDIDGEPLLNPPAIGCDEVYAGPITGPLSAKIQAVYTNLVIGYVASFSAQITGRASGDFWDFGDGMTVSNRPYVSHAWSTAGNFVVRFVAFNDSNAGGITSSLTVHIAANSTYYVTTNNENPVFPYTSWATAATNIQDAVDAATDAGSTVLVSNGVYSTGGRAVSNGGVSNRVTVLLPVLVRSVHGPEVTVIQGFQVPGTIYGTNAVRCVYLDEGAMLSGFTIRGGATKNAGNALDQSGSGVWCTSPTASISNCVLRGNAAFRSGGGAYSGTLYDCALVGNSAGNRGGGSYGSSLNNCSLTGNSTASSGGGVYSANLMGCLVYYNLAPVDPNYSASSLNFCCTAPLPSRGIGNTTAEPRLADNFHLNSESPCRNAGNVNSAAGTDIDGEPWLNPPSIGCDEYHAGMVVGQLTSAIHAAFTNLATGFSGNFSGLIDGHASSNSWDFGDGTAVSNRPYASHAWASPGDYVVTLWVANESNPIGLSTSTIVHVLASPVHYVSAGNATPVAPYLSWATAATNIQNAVDAAFAGGDVIVSNGVYSAGGRVVFGAMTNRVAVYKPLRIQSVNGPTMTIIEGYQTPGITNDDHAVRCVFLAQGASLSGFTLRNGATRSNGDIDQEEVGGGILCESTNAFLYNCVLSGNVARFWGGGASSGTLNDCTLTGNRTLFQGGGAAHSVLNRCTLTGNVGDFGAGAIASTLYGCTIVSNFSGFIGGGGEACDWDHCTLIGNSAKTSGGAAITGSLNNCLVAGNSAMFGGGIDGGTLTNCIVVGNSATYGGGAYGGTLNNCIVYFNSGPNGSNYFNAILNYCASTPTAINGPANITNDPVFVDWAGGDFHLQPDSPCINAGNNTYVIAGTDLEGDPRISGGTVDMGAYEFQNPASILSYAWLQQYGFPTDGSADDVDTDGDHMNTWQEWIAGTVPIDPLSVLVLFPPNRNNSTVSVSWQSVSNRTYFLERSSNLDAHPAFLTIATNIPGQSAITTYLDTNAIGPWPFFYRVGIQTRLDQFQFASSAIPSGWLQEYDLPTDGSGDFTDTDNDGMTNWQEWRAGTIPVNATSRLKMLTVTNDVSGTTLTWQSVAGVTYYLQRSNLKNQSGFSTVQSNILGQAGMTTFTDPTATAAPLFYRVGVQ